MTVVFVSNFYNDHQHAFSRRMVSLTDGNYWFIATKPVSKERLSMGWEERKDTYVLQYQEEPERCQRLIDSADAVILGSSSEELVKSRLKKGKLVFKYSERLYKKAPRRYMLLLRRVKNFFRWQRYKNLYLLCASAYAAGDYALTGNFIGKAYKWGYFPEVKKYENIDLLFEEKKQNKPVSILWVGRLLDWKHPDTAVRMAKRLRDSGVDFEMNIIGMGEMEACLANMVQEYNLEDRVHLLGSKKPHEVRGYMERANIYLFTSDRGEGWGAVLNESMNSGCAVIADGAIGAAPYLLNHRENGLIYTNEDELYTNLEQLVKSPALCESLGRKGYQTIVERWNAQLAADRLWEALSTFLSGQIFEKYVDGPMSKA